MLAPRPLLLAVLLAACAPDAIKGALPPVGGTDAAAPADAAPDAGDRIPIIVEPQSLLLDGRPGTVSVQLAAAPATELIVLVLPEPAIVAPSPVALMFNRDNFAQPQRLRLEPANGCGEQVGRVRLINSMLREAAIDVTVRGPAPRVEVSTATLSWTEGSTVALDVNLSCTPPMPVVLSASVADPRAARVRTAALTLGDTTPRRLVLEALEDLDADDAATQLDLAAPGYAPARVALEIFDDDTGGSAQLVLTATVVRVDEGMSASLGVSLSAPASATVRVTSADPSVVSATPAELRFTARDWDRVQTITLMALPDPDLDDAIAMLSLDSALGRASVTVRVRDRDNRLVARPGSLSIVEGRSESFELALARPNASDVVVSLSSTSAAIMVAPRTLTFRPGSGPLAVRLDAVEDADTMNERATVFARASGFPDARVEVRVVDDDALALAPSPATLVIREGASASFTVVLTQQPPGDVTVSARTDDASLSLDRGTLGFTAATWNVPQSLTVTAADDCDLAPGQSGVTLTAPGVVDGRVSVSVDDDDSGSLVVAPARLALTEGQTEALAVSLSFCGAARVGVAVSDATAIGASPGMLVFDAQNWNRPQSVSVMALQDPDQDDEMSAVSLESPGIPTWTVPVSVSDDDNGIIVSAAALNLREGGTATLTARLSRRPAADVDVTVTSANPNALVAAPATLRFGVGDWSTPQTITLSAPDDANTVSEMVDLTLSAPGLPAVVVRVTVNDDDLPRFVLTPATLSLIEGRSGTFTVALDAEPASDVTVALSVSDPSAASVTPASLNFTRAAFATPQTVTVNALQDCDLSAEMVNVALAATGVNGASLPLAVADDDTGAVLVMPASLNVDEGAQGMASVVLDFCEAATVTAMSSDPGAATVTPAMLSFTAQNWNVPQALTLAGVIDADTMNEVVTIALSSPGRTSAALTVNVRDRDTAAIVPSTTALMVAEGASTSFTVRLSAAPAAPLILSITSADPGAVTVAPNMLSFDGASFATPQMVTVNGVQDLDANDESVNLSLSATGYPNVTVAVNVVDDEVQSIVVNPASLALVEGASGTFTANLAAAPGGSAMLTIVSSDPGAATVAPSTLNFTDANYTAPQTVTVTAVQDADQMDESVNITLSGAGTRVVTVAITDDDRPPPMSFFITSRRMEIAGVPVSGGNFGGLAGADAFCLALAREANPADNRTWRAYLSTPNGDARDRIGAGPWHNAMSQLIAMNVAQLHSNPPPTNLILDETGGAWNAGSTFHDVLTGSKTDGTRFQNLMELMLYFSFPDGSFTYPNPTFDFSCATWSTDGPGGPASGLTNYGVVGHADWSNLTGRSAVWNTSHATGCDITNMNADGGDARLYCFAAN